MIVAALVDAGPRGQWAEAIVAGEGLVAPHLALVESADTLRRLQRHGDISEREASSAYQDLLTLDLVLLDYEPFAERVWALRANVSSYDAWYVAAAEMLELPLASLDGRLARAKGPCCEFKLFST